jgi:hypothetical protein
VHSSHLLQIGDYARIRNAMMLEKPERPPANEDLFNEDLRFTNWAQYTDTSFTRQIVDVDGRGTPDAFVFTIKSAIPVADSVRGFYETSGKNTPLLLGIGVNQMMAHGYMMDERASKIEFSDELERLTPIIQGMARVCVIDQYVCTGNTIRTAVELISRAGVNDVETIQGLWYQEALPSEIDISGMSSKHSDFMNNIGHQI